MGASEMIMNAHTASIPPLTGIRVKRMVFTPALSPIIIPRARDSPNVAGIVTGSPPGVGRGRERGSVIVGKPVAAGSRGAMLAVAIWYAMRKQATRKSAANATAIQGAIAETKGVRMPESALKKNGNEAPSAMSKKAIPIVPRVSPINQPKIIIMNY
jgi:hypothetical protein